MTLIIKNTMTITQKELDRLRREWASTETYRTLRLWGLDLLRLSRHTSSNQYWDGGEGQVTKQKIDPLLIKKSLSELMGHCFVLVDPRKDSCRVPLAAQELCGLRVKVFTGNDYAPPKFFTAVRLLTHPLWLSRGMDCYEKMQAYRRSKEFKEAMRMEKIHSLLKQAAP